jgi:hypothetical protein
MKIRDYLGTIYHGANSPSEFKPVNKYNTKREYHENHKGSLEIEKSNVHKSIDKLKLFDRNRIAHYRSKERLLAQLDADIREKASLMGIESPGRNLGDLSAGIKKKSTADGIPYE